MGRTNSPSLKSLALSVLAAGKSVPPSTSAVPTNGTGTERANVEKPDPVATCGSPQCARSPVAPTAGAERADAGYHASVEAALDTVCRPDYPPGMVLWLESAAPELYDRLTCSLPNLISGLWNAHAPLEKFQTVVDEWLETHSRACSLFKSYER